MHRRQPTSGKRRVIVSSTISPIDVLEDGTPLAFEAVNAAYPDHFARSLHGPLKCLSAARAARLFNLGQGLARAGAIVQVVSIVTDRTRSNVRSNPDRRILVRRIEAPLREHRHSIGMLAHNEAGTHR